MNINIVSNLNQYGYFTTPNCVPDEEEYFEVTIPKTNPLNKWDGEDEEDDVKVSLSINLYRQFFILSVLVYIIGQYLLCRL